MGKRSVGRRRVKSGLVVGVQTGIDSSQGFNEGERQVAAVEREIAQQDAAVERVLNKSGKARQKMASNGIFGGLSG